MSRKRRSKPEEHAKRVRDGVDRTARWLDRCVKAHRRADAQGLQWSIVIFACGYGWAALHYLLAGRTLQADMIAYAAPAKG
jgi:hypothetical protein